MGDPCRRAVCPGLVLAPEHADRLGRRRDGRGACRLAFWGYGVYDERQRELVAITVEPAAEAASRTSPGIACGEGELLVSITNGSGKTVTGVRFNVGAYREGRSTNIAKGNWFDDDHIINPRGTVSACWKAPGLTRDPEGDRVVWKASIIKLEFAE